MKKYPTCAFTTLKKSLVHILTTRVAKLSVQVSVKIFYLFPMTFSQKTDGLYIDLMAELFKQPVKKFLIMTEHIQELEVHN